MYTHVGNEAQILDLPPLIPPMPWEEISGSPPLQGGVRGGEKDLCVHPSY